MARLAFFYTTFHPAPPNSFVPMAPLNPWAPLYLPSSHLSAMPLCFNSSRTVVQYHHHPHNLSPPFSYYVAPQYTYIECNCEGGEVEELHHVVSDSKQEAEVEVVEQLESRKPKGFRRWRRNRRRVVGKHDFNKVEEALLLSDDAKTSLMIRNLPNQMSKEEMLRLLDDHCRQENCNLPAGEALSAFDFFYLPIDFETSNNLGYAFVNFTSPTGAQRLQRYLHHKDWRGSFKTRKVCEVAYAKIQGLDALLGRFQNSRFVCYSEDYLPVRFTPERDGSCETMQSYVGKHVFSSRGRRPIVPLRHK